ncbi:MAG: DUF4837 family protein [Saprospiraceae bacterium]|nr:DUF4837 family protein [Saprospiraceae bacterium]
MSRLFLKVSSLLVVISLVLGSCTEEARKRLEPTPIAVGSLNQLAIIADQEIWEGPIGDSISYYFGSAYPILPQPEPLFDLKHFTPDDLQAESSRRSLKAYLIVADMLDEESATTQLIAQDLGSEKTMRARQDTSYSTNMGHDRWAKDQVIVYLFGAGEKDLARKVVTKFPSIARVMQEQYREQIDATVYLGGNNNILMNRISQLFGCRIDIPTDYKINTEEDSTLWLIRENELIVTNLLIHKLPYTDQSQFEKNSIIALRDTLGKYNVSSSLEGTYMRTNTVDLPIYTQTIQLDGSYAVETRGIWEMEGDFLAGPFVSYLILNEDKTELVYIDAFILAPGERKRNQMLYLEHIVSSFTWDVKTAN